MKKKIYLIQSFYFLFCLQSIFGQCDADAGNDMQICDGEGGTSNYVYLDGSRSEVAEGEIGFEWSVLTIVGDGTQTRDFTFVTDVVEAIICAVESEICG